MTTARRGQKVCSPNCDVQHRETSHGGLSATPRPSPPAPRADTWARLNAEQGVTMQTVDK
jgi:hypothetical protein